MYLMIVFTWGVAGWFFYDGFVAWPKQPERANRYLELREQITDDAEFEAAWYAEAEAKGWPRKDPGKPKTNVDIAFQRWLGGIIALLGAGMVFHLVRSNGQVLKADDEAVTSVYGTRVPYSTMRSVDRRKWDNKGIAVVEYEGENGKRGKLIIDDYKFEGGEEILMEVERRLGIEKAPEPQPDQPPAEGEEPKQG